MITGGTSGINRLPAELFTSNGHLVYVTFRKDPDFAELNNIENVQITKVDVTNSDLAKNPKRTCIFTFWHRYQPRYTKCLV